MARAPKHCGVRGCTTLVPGGTRCPAHQHRWDNATRRASKASDTAHKAWRKAVLDRDKWQCQIRYQGCTGRATIADHILATKFGGAEHSLANGQAACRPCSDKKSADEGHQAQGHRVQPRPTSL